MSEINYDRETGRMYTEVVVKHEMVFRLSPSAAARMVAQDGVRVEAFGGDSIGDDDLLFRFHLPDGRTLDYTSRRESDYYGGHYVEADWHISWPSPNDTAAMYDDGAIGLPLSRYHNAGDVVRLTF